METENAYLAFLDQKELPSDNLLLELTNNTDGDFPAEDGEKKTESEGGTSLEMFDFGYDFDDKTPSLVDQLRFEYFNLTMNLIHTLTFSSYSNTCFSPPDFL